MAPQNVDDSEIVRQAARWVERLSEPVDAATRQEFAEWIRESPKHSRYFLAQAAIDAMVREYATGSVHPADVVEALQDTDFGAANQWRRPPRADLSRRYRPMAAAAAGLLGVVLGGPPLWEWWQSRGWAEYSATADMPLQITLKDQSVVSLQDCAQLLVRYTDDLRALRTTKCNASFKTHREPGRPFRVSFEGGVAEAKGTEFSIGWRGDHSHVQVQEGHVAVRGAGTGSEADLFASESASVSLAGDIRKLPALASVSDNPMRSFRNTPLKDVVAEFNRTHPVPRFIFRGNAGNKLFNGTVHLGSADGLIETLRSYDDLEVERNADVVTVQPKTE